MNEQTDLERAVAALMAAGFEYDTNTTEWVRHDGLVVEMYRSGEYGVYDIPITRLPAVLAALDGKAVTMEDVRHLTNALDWLVHLANGVGRAGGPPCSAEWDAAWVEAEAALVAITAKP